MAKDKNAETQPLPPASEDQPIASPAPQQRHQVKLAKTVSLGHGTRLRGMTVGTCGANFDRESFEPAKDLDMAEVEVLLANSRLVELTPLRIETADAPDENPV